MKRHQSTKSAPLPKYASLWFFFIVVFAWSWLFWIPAVALNGTETLAGAVLAVLGLLGPMVGGILCTYLTQGTEGRRDYWRRIIDARRIGARWYLVIVLFAPILMGITFGLVLLSGGNTAPYARAFAIHLPTLLSILPFALYIFFAGPFPEELGWRGYALVRLQDRWNALVSSLILGIFWALWHLPLFFMKGMYQYDQGGFGSTWFWLFLIGLPPLSVVFTWIFNNNRRSTLATIIFHFMIVFTDELLNVTMKTNVYSTLLWVLAAIVITGIWGARTLTGKGILKTYGDGTEILAPPQVTPV
jgi:membrane protease YdiL (CAAX protease family)